MKKSIVIRYYKDGSVELPDGRIIREKDCLELAADKDKRFPIEMFKEVFGLMKMICLEEHKMVRYDLDEETILYFEFIDENLSDSRNPALSN